jgi:hypothetical protein
MAIKLIANYSKRLGLPGYSSHQFSVSVETELSTADDIARESVRLYQLLQRNVDAQMQQTGFVPPGDYGMDDASSTSNHNHASVTSIHDSSRWQCSDKQKDLILKLVNEHQLDKQAIDQLSRERFGKTVRQLSKLEASGLIDELLDTYGGGQRSQPPAQQRQQGSAYRRNSRKEAA